MLRANDTVWTLLGRPERTPDSGAAARTPVINSDPNITANLANRFTTCDIVHSSDESSHPQR